MFENGSTVVDQSIDEILLAISMMVAPRTCPISSQDKPLDRARAIASTSVLSIAIDAQHGSVSEADWSTRQLPRCRTRRHAPCLRVPRTRPWSDLGGSGVAWACRRRDGAENPSV